MATLLCRTLQNNQKLRSEALKRNKSIKFNNTWWFHDVHFLRDMSRIYQAFVEDSSLDFSHDSDQSKAEHDALEKNLSVLTVKELE